MEQPTTAELKQAFKASRLWVIGYSFHKAMSISAIRIALTCAAKAARRNAEQTGRPAPAQLGLI